MEKVIKSYNGKTGKVTVTKYIENGNTEYRVKHSTLLLQPYWTINKAEAVIHAQFLSRY